MVDKITTVPKSKFGVKVVQLDDEDMVRLNQALTVFLGMAMTPRTRRGKSSCSLERRCMRDIPRRTLGVDWGRPVPEHRPLA